MAKRLALVQAESGDICELDPLLEEEEACTRSGIGRLADELAHQGHMFVRHNKGLKCKGSNVCRADRQFNSGAEHLASLGHLRPTSPVSETRIDRTSTLPQTIRFAASLVFRLFPPV